EEGRRSRGSDARAFHELRRRRDPPATLRRRGGAGPTERAAVRASRASLCPFARGDAGGLALRSARRGGGARAGRLARQTRAPVAARRAGPRRRGFPLCAGPAVL